MCEFNIQELNLANYRRFENETFTLNPRMNVFAGKNGSGKTMLMRAICGLILPTEGFVDIDGEILGKDISFPKSIGALIETPSFIPNYSGFKNLKVISMISNKISEEKIIQTYEKKNINFADIQSAFYFVPA